MSFQWLTDVGLFALLFFILVFVHELGHFLMAKWVGIKVERFAIGMGPSLFSFRKGDTEYKLGALPLGGYVKMLGDDPTRDFTEEERKHGFLAKTPAQKLLVVFGGPGFNMILPILLFGLMLATGIPTVQPVVGSLEDEFPAKQAGLKEGDRVLSLDGVAIKKWNQIEQAVEKSRGETIRFEVERRNLETNKLEKSTFVLTPKLANAKSKYGEDIQAYRLGLGPDFTIPQLFYDNDQSPLGRAGIKRLDRVTKINGVEITTLEQLHEALALLKPGPISFEVERKGEISVYQVILDDGKGSVEERLGFRSPGLVIGGVEKNSPAERAGLKGEDLLLAIDGVELKEWEDVAKAVRSSQGKPVEVKWSRNGEILSASMTPEQTVIENPLMGKDDPLARDPIYRIGVASARVTEKALFIERSMNPWQWLTRGITETISMTQTTVVALYKLFTGQLSLKLLGSPIMIYKVAGNSYRMVGGGYLGWFSFLSNLALLSITLGLVNLLPIPVLDGGHATFFTIEWIRGRPVSVRVMELATQVGLFILIALFGVVLFNDFHRYGFFDSFVKLFR